MEKEQSKTEEGWSGAWPDDEGSYQHIFEMLFSPAVCVCGWSRWWNSYGGGGRGVNADWSSPSLPNICLCIFPQPTPAISWLQPCHPLFTFLLYHRCYALFFFSFSFFLLWLHVLDHDVFFVVLYFLQWHWQLFSDSVNYLFITDFSKDFRRKFNTSVPHFLYLCCRPRLYMQAADWLNISHVKHASASKLKHTKLGRSIFSGIPLAL